MKVFLVILCFLSQVIAQEIRIAAASDLQFALSEIAELFETENEVKVLLSFGSSGNIYSQLEQGAPFDLFLSASSDYTKRLEAKDLLEPNSRKLYAVGRLVIWVHNSLGLKVETLQEQTLLSSNVQHIAIANPDHAPYGQAAVDFLTKTGLYEHINAKLIYGENISQAAQLALSSGNVGIIALSLAINPVMQEAGTYWLIPLEDHLRLEQEMAILKNQARTEVQIFYEFMQSDDARAILESYGFVLP